MIRKITVYVWYVMAMFLCSKGSLWRATDDLLQRTMPYLLIPKTKLVTFCLLTKAAADIQTVVSGTLVNIFFKSDIFHEEIIFVFEIYTVVSGTLRKLRKIAKYFQSFSSVEYLVFSHSLRFASYSYYSCIKKNTMDLKEGDGADQMLVARHETEQDRGSKPSCTKHSLKRALKQMFGLEYLMFHLLTMLRVVCKFIKPQLLR